MDKPTRAVYTSTDFQGWHETSSLVLTPKFQRRGVWKTPARSFFIDTLLRELPVPPIYIRVAQSEDKKRVIREVIDGQQRVSAVLDYLAAKYRLSKTLKAPWSNKTFSQLTETEKDRIRTYGFSAEMFHGASDAEVLELFSRLNTYSVPLNSQELRNGKFFGLFKQTAYALARQRLEFWRQHKVFTEQNIARMIEAEFVSEVLIAQLAGMQDKKKSIDDFYERFDEVFPAQAQVEKRFNEIVDTVSNVAVSGLSHLEFRRPPLLYTLLCVIHHRLFGLPGQSLPTPKKALSQDEQLRLVESMDKLSAMIEKARAKEPVPTKYQGFVAACLTQTDNIRPRAERFRFLYRLAFE